MAVSRHLGLYQTGNSATAPFDPPTPKTIAYTQTWSGLDALFARYSPLNYTVTLKLGFGSLKVIVSSIIRSAHVDRQTGCEVVAIFVYPRWLSAASLDFIELQIAKFDPLTPKILT